MFPKRQSCQASGEDYAKFLTCVILSGPVLVGYTQTLNDWYDKDLDAINEPYRPIPSGRITEAQTTGRSWGFVAFLHRRTRMLRLHLWDMDYLWIIYG